MIYDFQKELIAIAIEISSSNRSRVLETQSLVRHMESLIIAFDKSTREVIEQCRENMKEINKSSDKLINLLEKLEKSKENP